MGWVRGEEQDLKMNVSTRRGNSIQHTVISVTITCDGTKLFEIGDTDQWLDMLFQRRKAPYEDLWVIF